MKSICYIRNPSPGVNYHRLEIPFSYIANEGYKVTETDIYKLHDDEYDVMVFNRIPNQPISTIEKLKGRGVRIIMDIDDYWIRPEWHGLYSPQWEGEYFSTIIKLLRLADVVWVSTPYLQERIAEMLIPSVLIPNAISYEEEQFQPIKIERKKLNCGWIGATNHHMDFKQLIVPFKQPQPCQMVLGGMNQPDEYWKYMAQVVTGGKISQVKIMQALDVYNYAVMYNDLDIVILPSYHDTYTLCKSNLKLLEAGAFSLPVITNGAVYKEVNDKIGIRVDGGREWIKAIKKLNDSRRMRSELGQALHEYTKEKYDLQKFNKIRIQTL